MKSTWLSFLVVAAITLPAKAALFSENFSADPTANWTTNAGPSVNSVDYFYDYSTVGIPSAPSGTGTRGLKLQANLNPNIAGGLTGPGSATSPGGTYAAGGVFGGVTVSPTGLNLAGDYRLTFDWWGNYNGPVNGGGNGTTQVSQFGVGTNGTASQWIGATTMNSVHFAATLDGGSATDFRAYSSAAPTSYASGNAVYAAPSGAINNSNAYYAALLPSGATAPASQVTSFPLQTGSTAAGVTGFSWNQVLIEKAGNFVRWSVDGTLIATVDLTTVTLSGSNILFGMSDTNAASSVDATHPQLLFTLIDNIVVEAIPEPSAFLFGLVGTFGAAGATLIRRRKSVA